MLEALGLSDAEEDTYRALMATSPATVAQLTERLNAPKERVRRTLHALTASGLVARAPGRTPAYSAVDPRVGLAALIRERRAELDAMTTTVEAYSSEYHERMLLTGAQHFVELIEGPSAITARLAELMAGAEHEVLAFDAPPYVTADLSASTAERDLLAREVRVRAVYANEVLAIPSRAERIRDLVTLGESARVLPRVPLKMVIVDRRTAVIPLTASAQGTRSTAALVRRSLLCDALVELFEANWDQAAPVFAAGVSSADIHPEISPADQALLHLLHAGLKDDAIARNLDISERTLRRRITELTTRLGASSRFQAGAQAVRRGWL